MPQHVTLLEPIKHGGTEISVVTVLPPKVQHQLAAQKSPGTDTDRELFLFAMLTTLTSERIGGMHTADYAKLQKAYKDFLS